ncbi:hypothetical protein [Tumebacillus flagellatus]|uniref:Uncharacterized protein n=1 Tax=Tumebacillus flagellatus TaxID=1157490 RepID=A0A074LWH5_9BACL|nr:hypothetical protein [Tumebacillus flagellatus]KEO85229.1 hypothetical protein EL26_01335 [Tumebacillus flagellatus]
MKVSWKKVVLIAAPLVLAAGGAGYAVTGTTKTTENADQAANASNVSAQVVSSVPLTAEEAAQLGNAKPVQVADASTTNGASTAVANPVDQATLDANNPFVVQQPAATSATGSTATASTGSADSQGASGAGTAVASNFQLNSVHDLHFETNTTQGNLKVEFKQEKGTYKLDGELGGRKMSVQGDQALQIMTQLLNGFQLQGALTSALLGKQVQLDPRVLSSIRTLDIEMNDGRKIESKGAKPGTPPKEEGKHDNGKHKGEQKQEDKGKGKKHDD